MFGKKRIKKQRAEICRVNGEKMNKLVCFKDTNKHGVQYGYIRHNKTYIQVSKSGKTWTTKKRGILSFLFSLIF